MPYKDLTYGNMIYTAKYLDNIDAASPDYNTWVALVDTGGTYWLLFNATN